MHAFMQYTKSNAPCSINNIWNANIKDEGAGFQAYIQFSPQILWDL